MVLTEAQGRLNVYVVVVFQKLLIYILTSKQQSTFYTLAVYIFLVLQHFPGRVMPLSGFTYHVYRPLVALFGLGVGPSQGGYLHKTKQTQAVDLFSVHTYSNLVPALTIMNGGEGRLSLFSSDVPGEC
jgi:hypothetical protein